MNMLKHVSKRKWSLRSLCSASAHWISRHIEEMLTCASCQRRDTKANEQPSSQMFWFLGGCWSVLMLVVHHHFKHSRYVLWTLCLLSTKPVTSCVMVIWFWSLCQTFLVFWWFEESFVVSTEKYLTFNLPNIFLNKQHLFASKKASKSAPRPILWPREIKRDPRCHARSTNAALLLDLFNIHNSSFMGHLQNHLKISSLDQKHIKTFRCQHMSA